jgi:acyl-CoA reductase-like NAD-dependent aldehyde dehydrogenase
VLEKDVHDARSHMNLSQWNRYSPEERRQILSEIGSLVRNHRMPPARYTSLHPEASLSDYDAELLYQWTRTQRSRLH